MSQTSYDWQFDPFDDTFPSAQDNEDDETQDAFDQFEDEYPWQWTPRTAGHNSSSTSTMPELHRPDGKTYVPTWLCTQCKSAQWRVQGDGCVCMSCGNRSFYDAGLPRSQDTGLGSWTYVPSHDDAGNDPVRGGRRHREPRPFDEPKETAESEVPTDDPVIDPSSLEPLKPSRRQRKALRRAKHSGGRDSGQPVPAVPAQAPQPAPRLPGLHSKAQQCDPPARRDRPVQASPPDGGRGIGGGKGSGKPDAGSDQAGSSKSNVWRDQMLKNMHDVHQKSQQEKPWDISKGPAPGIKYRGGAPPLPPQWDAHRGDLQAFQRWEKKLAVWRRQIKSYLPPNEASMYLYVNLSGEAAEELEHCELDRIDHDQGIEYILETLRTPLMVKGVYLKRKFLDDFERLSRRNGESIRAFTNRYHRCERSLQSVGVQVSNMYDDEAAGSRLMDRMRLGAEAQRMILIATGNSLRYRDIKEAAETQFPEHRATPTVVYNRDFEDTPKEPRDRGRDRPGGPPRGQWKTKDGKGKGKDSGKSSGKGSSSTFVRSSYITEIPEGGQSEDEHAPAEEDELGGDETPQEAADADPTEQEADQASDAAEDFSDLDLAAHCLTVTARRLSNMRLGRKFSGGGKSISQRKAESHCAVCGQKGHWQGDKECPQSASSSSEVKPKTGKDDSKTKGAGKKVLSVLHPDGHNRSVNFNLDSNNDKETPYGTYFTYMVTSPAITPSRTLGDGLHQVFGANLETYEHHLIMDTACQKTCCSNTWLDRWTRSWSFAV